MTILLIARHGNTFEAGEPPRRVGAGTDIPLVERGREQATALGRYLREHNLIPDEAYSSTLSRTQETAQIALKECGIATHVFPLKIFDEIDYGPDENKTEEEVIARIGEEAIENWDREAIVPEGWNVNPQELIENWQGFADNLHEHEHDHEPVVLVVTSNGIARFAPYLTGDFEAFKKNFNIKISTGALCVLKFTGNRWTVLDWNIKPE